MPLHIPPTDYTCDQAVRYHGYRLEALRYQIRDHYQESNEQRRRQLVELMNAIYLLVEYETDGDFLLDAKQDVTLYRRTANMAQAMTGPAMQRRSPLLHHQLMQIVDHCNEAISAIRQCQEGMSDVANRLNWITMPQRDAQV